MPKNVAIVESPAKAKTIAGYLGSDWVVESSYGHVRDLPKKQMGIDTAKNFEPTYIIPDDKQKRIRELKKITKGAETVWLATDEDREGEAIAWHLAQALGLETSHTNRIVFHEITKTALESAVANPRGINLNLVNAQQARRVLDRLVGYELSPILWRKITTGLSAGRVQSVAVRLIVEREQEIDNHKPIASFKTSATFITDSGKSFPAELEHKFKDEAAATQFLKDCLKASFSVADLQSKTAAKSPPPPFTTSSLQQTASNNLGSSVSRTMVLAQKLYEAGHITYMRTDSVAIAEEALAQAGKFIVQKYGADYHHRRQFATKSKLAQEAHEAIRPTNFATEQVSTDSGQQKLYNLIRQRALASQMAAAKIDRTTARIKISDSEHTFKADGEVIVFSGFLTVYSDKAIQDRVLPKLEAGQKIDLTAAESTQTLSKPKARYTEASLVRQLEKLGIGRPSTYAPTISTIQARGYVEKTPLEGTPHQITVLKIKDGQFTRTQDNIILGAAKNKLLPTPIGRVVNDFLVKNFADVLDYKFTAQVEARFDAVAAGELDWPQMIADFYGPFHKDVTKAADVSRQEAVQMRQLGTEPKSGRPVFARIGRYGPMIQVGKTEDDAKPKFAPIPKNLRLDTITFEQAMELLKLPRTVGKTEAGDEILATIGPFGPYLKAGSTNVSLKTDDPLTINLTRARELVAEKQDLDAKKIIQTFAGGKIQVLNGPYGAYISDGKARRPVPKDQDPAKITLKQAQEILNSPPKRRPRR